MGGAMGRETSFSNSEMWQAARAVGVGAVGDAFRVGAGAGGGGAGGAGVAGVFAG